VSDELPNPLQKANKVGLLGDQHGDLNHFLLVSRTMWSRGISVMVQLGDWGFVWPGENWDRTLNKISRRLAAQGQTLYFFEGNHDWIPRLHEFAQDVDGLRRLRANIILFPRGYRVTLAAYNKVTPGKILAVLPGASSVDREHRTEGSDWWPEEAITDEDLAALGSERADILLGHEVPIGVWQIEHEIDKNPDGWSEAARAYAAEGRRQFYRGFLAVRPRVSAGGHWHRHIDTKMGFNDGTRRFSCRVVVLDMNGAETMSQAILDTSSLTMEFFRRGDSVVERLTMRDQGRWAIRSEDAVYAFDLDRRTVERRPEPGARLSPNLDQPRPLLDIRMLQVGDVGIWSLDPVADDLPDYEHFAPRVESIERKVEL